MGHPSTDPHEAEEQRMSYNNTLQMYVVNNTGGNAVFAFSHQYSDDQPVEFQSTTAVAPGASAGPLIVGFNTGFGRTGLDYWYCQATVTDGENPGTYATEGTLQAPTKECECQSADSGMIYHFPFSTTSFVMPLLSGPCQTGVSR
jgi:1,6-anhydro-N-acetylmuramate kinase